jgi:hypothetical protein
MPSVSATPAPQQSTPPPQPVAAGNATALNATQEEVEQTNDNLMKLHARSDAVRGSLDRLRQQQAAEGLGLSMELSSSASRLDNYLQAADRAVQNNDVQSARKYMEKVEKEVTFLEQKFGR